MTFLTYSLNSQGYTKEYLEAEAGFHRTVHDFQVNILRGPVIKIDINSDAKQKWK